MGAATEPSTSGEGNSKPSVERDVTLPYKKRTCALTNAAVRPGVSQLTVTWAAASGANGYFVQWKSGTQVWGATRQRSVGSSSTITDTIPSLTPGTTYTVLVDATAGTSISGCTDHRGARPG